MQLFKDTHLVKLELLFNATTIDNALNYIRSKQQHQKKGHDLDSTDDDEPAIAQLLRQVDKQYFR